MAKATSPATTVKPSVMTTFSYYHLSGVVSVGTYVLMLLGAYTSAIGAGLACPDWPTCYGTLIPFLHPGIVQQSPYTALQIFAEWAHRGLASVVGLGIVATAIGLWRAEIPDSDYPACVESSNCDIA
ncbi:MAG: COX15/CtaA family protein [Halobacteriaceae archaeon]